MARKLCHEKVWVLNLEIWVLKNGPKMVRKIVEKYFSQKCPKSISLDSGHLDKPFGPLIFNFSQYFLIFFLIDFLAYFSGLGTRWTPSLVPPLGRVLYIRCAWTKFRWTEKLTQTKPSQGKLQEPNGPKL